MAGTMINSERAPTPSTIVRIGFIAVSSRSIIEAPTVHPVVPVRQALVGERSQANDVWSFRRATAAAAKGGYNNTRQAFYNWCCRRDPHDPYSAVRPSRRRY